MERSLVLKQVQWQDLGPAASLGTWQPGIRLLCLSHKIVHSYKSSFCLSLLIFQTELANTSLSTLASALRHPSLVKGLGVRQCEN